MTGPKVAASSATPAPTDAGENGTSRPLPWAKATSRTAAGDTGTPKAARKQASEPRRQRAARQLPGQHLARVGARAAQRRAAAADARRGTGWRGPAAGRARRAPRRRAARRARKARWSSRAEVRADAERHADREQRGPIAISPTPSATSVPASSAHPRRAGGARAEHADGVTTARGDDSAGAGTRDPGGHRIRRRGSHRRRRRRDDANQPRPRATWLSRWSATPRTSQPGDTLPTALTSPSKAPSRAAAARTFAS